VGSERSVNSWPGLVGLFAAGRFQYEEATKGGKGLETPQGVSTSQGKESRPLCFVPVPEPEEVRKTGCKLGTGKRPRTERKGRGGRRIATMGQQGGPADTKRAGKRTGTHWYTSGQRQEGHSSSGIGTRRAGKKQVPGDNGPSSAKSGGWGPMGPIPFPPGEQWSWRWGPPSWAKKASRRIAGIWKKTGGGNQEGGRGGTGLEPAQQSSGAKPDRGRSNT